MQLKLKKIPKRRITEEKRKTVQILSIKCINYKQKYRIKSAFGVFSYETRNKRQKYQIQKISNSTKQQIQTTETKIKLTCNKHTHLHAHTNTPTHIYTHTHKHISNVFFRYIYV